MNSLNEIKQKVAHDQKFDSWDEYSAMFPVSSVDELAKACFYEGQVEHLKGNDVHDNDIGMYPHTQLAIIKE